MAFRVPFGTSDDGLPATVTRPGFCLGALIVDGYLEFEIAPNRRLVAVSVDPLLSIRSLLIREWLDSTSPHNAPHQRPNGRVADIWSGCMCLL
jgi:hypothetical protein